jgi:hypothetical protein
MSWEIFKQNILALANNPNNIPDIDTVANTYAKEYDAAVKRSGDSISKIAVEKGNVEIMEKLFKVALQQGLTATGPYDLVAEMGKGVLAYWQGATLQKIPIPIIPSPGSVANIAVTGNSVTNPGKWQPAPPAASISPVQSAEAEAIQRDIKVEYPKSQKLYEAQFKTEEAAMAHNSNVTPTEALANVKAFREETGASDPSQYKAPQSAAEPSQKSNVNNDTEKQKNDTTPPKAKPVLVGRGDEALYKRCGNGEWPAVGQPGSFKIDSKETAGGCPREWYVQNEKYLVKNCTQILFPTKNGNVKITVHKDLAAIVKPAIAQIKAAGLHKYILDCGGGLAVRNVTCGTRLSNHSWGTAIDMNTDLYPYGYKFKDGAIYKGKTKIRDLNEFDKGFQQVAAIFKSSGMTWLSNNDPMHVSIYE